MALGVIALGRGGLEAESVMLGPSFIHGLPILLGVELNRQAAAGITANPILFSH